MTLNAWDLIAGVDIVCQDICTIRQPKLSNIKELGQLGLVKYDDYLKTLTETKDGLVETLKLIKAENIEEIQSQEWFTPFNVLISSVATRQKLQDALSFFVKEPLVFDEEHLCFNVMDANDSVKAIIHNGNYEIVKDAILQISCIANPEPPVQKFRNERARKIYEKCMAGKKELEKAKKKSQKSNKNLVLENIVASVAANHPSYNLFNIWELTIYQLYDQFQRVDIGIQHDVYATRWAAYGQDSYDFEMWKTNIH